MLGGHGGLEMGVGEEVGDVVICSWVDVVCVYV